MRDFEHYEDQIATFLTGALSRKEQAEFEAELGTNPRLQEAVTELRRVRQGLNILDMVSGGHIDSQALVLYADEPDQIDNAAARKIADHLELCPDCREELLICQESVLTVATLAREARPSMMSVFVEWLFTPRLAWRPAYGLVVIAVLAMPVAYIWMQPDLTGSVLPVRLVPLGMRSQSATVERISITSPEDIIRLQSSIPDIEDQLVSYALHYDGDQRLEFARHDSLRGNSFDLEIPARYFPRDGMYTLRVLRLADDGDQAIPYEFRIEVTHSR